MPGKMARSDPRPSFGLPELLVAIHTSRQSCCKGGKARIFTPVRESSGEFRLKPLRRAARAAKETPIKLSRTVGLAVAVSLPRFLPPPTRRIAP
jgi:hypothetical protein